MTQPATSEPISRDVKTRTPWGQADYAYTYGAGVILYNTPGHGGFHLSATRNAVVHEAWRRASGWYEEDCEANIVVLTFPELFSACLFVECTAGAKTWYPDEYETVFGVAVGPEESYVRARQIFTAEHADDLVVISAVGSRGDLRVPAGYVGATARAGGRDGTGPVFRFLVSEEAYATRSQFGFVVDPAVWPVWA